MFKIRCFSDEGHESSYDKDLEDNGVLVTVEVGKSAALYVHSCYACRFVTLTNNSDTPTDWESKPRKIRLFSEDRLFCPSCKTLFPS